MGDSMENQNQEYDFGADQSIDLSNQNNVPPQPSLDESMFDPNVANFYQDFDNFDDLAAENAIPLNQPMQDVPDHILESTAATMVPDSDLKLTDFSLFLNGKYDDLNEIAKLKNPSAPPIGHDSVFEKNIQSQWFVDYNKLKAENGETEKMLLCKANGLFYSDRDTPETALKDFGFDDNEAKALAPHMDFTFIGNTEIRGSKGKGIQRGQFKTFVLNLKDPTSPESVEALAKIVAQKTKHVQSHIDKTYNLDKAKEKILSRVNGLVDAETAKTGTAPFVGVGPALFLNNRAVYERLSEIPEIKDKFKIEPLDVNGNKITYTGFSEGLNSYFDAEIKLHKVVTKDPLALPQSELEHIISEHLKDEKEPLLVIPEHDDNKIIEKQHEKSLGASNTVDNVQIKDGIPAKPKNTTLESSEFVPGKQKINEGNPGNISEEFEDDGDRRRRKRPDNNQRMSFGEIALRATQKIAEKSLKALLRLAQMIAMALLALLQSILALGNRGMTKAFGTKPYFEYPDMTKTFRKNEFISNLFENKKGGPSNNNEKELGEKNDIKAALDEVFADQKPSDPKLENTPENNLAKQMAVLGASTELDLLKNASVNAEKLDDHVKDDLSAQANQDLSSLSEDEKKAILATVSIPAAHQFGEDLPSKVTPTLMFDDTHGVLLGKCDEVLLEDGTKAGVLSAYDVGGSLYYAVANESEDKNYNLNYVEASALTLLGHNKVTFDNESNLVAQADNAVIENYQQEHDGKIQKLDILDYAAPQENAIGVDELASRLQLLTHTENSELKQINFLDEFEGSGLKKRFDESLIYQVHHDQTNSLVVDPIHGQTHALFGKLLDVNDLIEAKLPQSGMMVEGAVTGAYVHDNQLYYSLLTDKNSYNLPAGDITLTKRNGGQLSASALQDKLIAQEWPENISREHKKGATPIILSHADASEGFNHKHSINKGAWVRTEPTDMLGQVGVKALLKNEQDEYIGANKIYSVIDNDKKRYFLSIGQTEEPTGQKHSIVLEVKKNKLSPGSFSPLDASKTSLQSLDMDNPSVVIEKNGGLTGFSSIIDHTRDMYESGSNKVKASLINTLANDISGKVNTNEHAESFYKDKVIASAVLAESALNAFVNKDENILGLDANLSQTKINDQDIAQSLNHPESQKILSDNSPIAADYYKPKQLLPNQVVLNEQVLSFDNLDNIMQVQAQQPQTTFADLGRNFMSLNGSGQIDEPISPVVSNPDPILETQEAWIEEPVNPRMQLVQQVTSIDSDLPESTLMRVALTYVTGDRYCSNQEGGIDLLSTKEALLVDREKINQDIAQLMPKIQTYFEGVGEDGRVDNISQVKVADLNGLKKLLNEDPEVKLRLSTILNKESVLASSIENHLDKIETRLEKIHGRLDLKEFDMDNIKTLDSVSNAFLSEVRESFEKSKSASDLVSILKEVKNADDGVSYSDIAMKVVNDGVKHTNSFADHLTSISSTFKPNTNQPAIEQDPNLKKEKSLDFNP